MSERAQFATKLGVIAATVGSAVGLGNIWRFPYMAGENGGGAFLIVYICCVIVLGIPLMCAEFAIGRKSRTNAAGALKVLAPKSQWHIIGYIGILASTLILGYYMVIAGWVVEYIYQAIKDNLFGDSATTIANNFELFKTDVWRPLVWVGALLVINYLIISRGVTKGIEKASNIMMPMLFVILLIFCGYAITLPGAKEGLTYLFNPDFSKIDGGVVLSAMGQAFFSLSIGLGILITYGSYFKRNVNLPKTGFTVAILDMLVAILAGVMIFPITASFGISPTQGPDLIFVTLPNVFGKMFMPNMWAILFFVFAGVAALTSTISLLEVAIAYISEEFKLSRKRASIIILLIVAVLSVLSSLSFSVLSEVKLFDMNFFELSDYFSANILLPLGGFLLSVYVGWRMKKRDFKLELGGNTQISTILYTLILFSIRFIAPISIIFIFLSITGIFNI
ncbi:MAG: sodium-dependent transporter [Bacteroidales bacterium]|nr:sodium-dependent transporter [Bacteroidales bacterium]